MAVDIFPNVATATVSAAVSPSNPSLLTTAVTAASEAALTSGTISPSYGQLIVVMTSLYTPSSAGATTLAITDTMGGLTWTQVTSNRGTVGSETIASIFWAVANGTPGTVTITPSRTGAANSGMTLTIYGVTGYSMNSAAKTAVSSGSATTTFAATPPQAGALVFGLLANGLSSDPANTIPAGSTSLFTDRSTGTQTYDTGYYNNSGAAPQSYVVGGTVTNAASVLLAVPTAFHDIGAVAGSIEQWSVTSSALFVDDVGNAPSLGFRQCRFVDPADTQVPPEVMLLMDVSGTNWTVKRAVESGGPTTHGTSGGTFTVQAVVTAGGLANARSQLPEGITGNIGLFDRETSIYHPPGCESVLSQINADMAATQQGVASLRRWAWIGASEVRFAPPSTNVTATTAPPLQFARALQRLGLPVADGMASLSDLSYGDSRWISPTAMTVAKIGNGIAAGSNGAASSITYRSFSPKTAIEFFYLDSSGAGTAFTYNIDGAGAVNVAFGGTNLVKRIAVTGLTAQSHSVVFTSVSATANAMTLFGANAYNTSDLTIDNWGSSGTGAGNSGAGLPIWDCTGTNNLYDMLNVVVLTAPTVAFVGLGVNDYLNTGTATTFKTALGNIINKLQTAGIQVVLIGAYPFTSPAMSPNDLPVSWRQVYYNLADTYAVPLIDLHDRWVSASKALAKGLLGNDTEVGPTYYLNPTSSGHSEIANSMVDMLGPTQPSLPLNNLNAGADPTVNDDNTRGYTIGSTWNNITTGWQFTAMSVGTGTAIWMRISPTSLVPAVVAQPGASNVLLPFTSLATSAVALTTAALNFGQFEPFIITKPTPISALAFNVTIIVSGGTAVNGRLALFNDNGAGGVGTLVADYGTTTFAGTGIRSISGARTLQPGIYWGGFKYEYTGVPTTHPTLTSMTTIISLPGPSMTSINYRSLQSTGTISGAFTSNPTATPSSVQAPVVGLVIA